MGKKLVIFTDLDSTLLEYKNYSYNEAEDALKLIKEKNIPLVFCTSKTRREIEFWRKKIGNGDPFISENGGGVFIPKNYFDFNFEYDKEEDGYLIKVFGEDFNKLKKVVDLLKEKYKIKSFLDMTADEISSEINLDLKQAEMARDREFDIPFKLIDKDIEESVLDDIKNFKLNYMIGGRFYHLMGYNNKGKAVSFLKELYKKKYDEIFTLGFGDSQNDFSMLEKVDKGFLVKRHDGTYSSDIFLKAEGIGPIAWNKVVIAEINKNL